jgi:DNA-directed RNA polymerase subunit beta'
VAELEIKIALKRLDYHGPVQWGHESTKRSIGATAGRVIFNGIIPAGLIRDLGFQNKVMRKKDLSELVFESYRREGLPPTVQFLDQLKEFGFRYATIGGVSIGVADLEIPNEKAPLLHDAEARVERFQRAYSTGQITFGERYNKVIDAWTHANNDIAEAMVSTMRRSKGGFNPVFMMFDSGSRGSRDQIRQLAGMRGLMAKPRRS